jgi:predicted acetyltransferase
MTTYNITSQSDQDAFYQLYLYAFNKTDSARRHEFFDARFNHAANYGIHNGTELVSALYSLPFTVNFHGIEYTMRGIGDVCSAPEYSGRGGAGTLLKTALNDMYTEGTTLSYLAPFAFTYYRRFGYEQVFNHTVSTLATTNLPRFNRSTAPGKVTREPLRTALPRVADIYAANQPTRGGLIRANWWWDYLVLKNDWDVGIYTDADGHDSGYVIYERTPEALTIKELIAPTAAEFTALRQFILKHGNTFTHIVLDAPNLDYRGDLLPEPGLAPTTIEPYMMARIVNLQTFLDKYPQPAVTKFTVAVTDPVIPENQGLWQFGPTGYQRLAAAADVAADVTISIQALTKILFGAQSAQVLHRTGEIQATVAGILGLDALSVKTTPSLVDYF